MGLLSVNEHRLQSIGQDYFKVVGVKDRHANSCDPEAPDDEWKLRCEYPQETKEEAVGGLYAELIDNHLVEVLETNLELGSYNQYTALGPNESRFTIEVKITE
jgi:hypothetical protein